MKLDHFFKEVSKWWRQDVLSSDGRHFYQHLNVMNFEIFCQLTYKKEAERDFCQEKFKNKSARFPQWFGSKSQRIPMVLSFFSLFSHLLLVKIKMNPNWIVFTSTSFRQDPSYFQKIISRKKQAAYNTVIHTR